MLDFTPVESSTIDGVAYDDVMPVLYVRFKSGEVWGYDDVPQSLYEAFLDAESKGSFFAKYIKKNHKGQQYADPQGEDDHGIAVDTAAPGTSDKTVIRSHCMVSHSYCINCGANWLDDRVHECPVYPKKSIRLGTIDL